MIALMKATDMLDFFKQKLAAEAAEAQAVLATQRTSRKEAATSRLSTLLAQMCKLDSPRVTGHEADHDSAVAVADAARELGYAAVAVEIDPSAHGEDYYEGWRITVSLPWPDGPTRLDTAAQVSHSSCHRDCRGDTKGTHDI